MEKRCIFSGSERTALLELVSKYRNVLENRKSDALSTLRKKKTWEMLTDEFNTMGGNTKRTMEQLKKCWENIKTRRKKELEIGRSYYNQPKDEHVDCLLNVVDTVIKEVKDSKIGLSELISYNSIADDRILNMVDHEIKDTIDSDTALQDMHENNETTDSNPVHEQVVPPTRVLIVPPSPTPSSSEPESFAVEILSAHTPSSAGHSNPTSAPQPATSRVRKPLARGMTTDKQLFARIWRLLKKKERKHALHELRVKEQKLKVARERVALKKEQLALIEQEMKTKIAEQQYRNCCST